MTRHGLLALAVTLLGCGDSDQRPNYEPVQTAWDDLPIALACNPDDDSQNCLEAGPDTIRIDDEDRLAVLSSDYDEAKQEVTLTLRPGASLAAKFREGTILHRGRKDRKPLLHRIMAMETQGQMVRLKVQRVSVKEAYPRGRIRVRVPLSNEGQPLALDANLASRQQAITVGIGPKDCAQTVFDKTLATPNVVGNIKLDLETCRFRLEAWATAILIWDTVAIDVDKVELSVGGGIDASLHAKLTADLNAAFGEQIRIWEGPEVAFTIGGILLTINPSLFAGYSLNAQASLTSTQGFDLVNSIEVGFGYSDKQGWYSIDERESTFTKFGPVVEIEGNVAAKAWLEPRLDLKAFGFVGGSLTLRGFVEADLESTAQIQDGMAQGEVCASLKVGLTPTVGAVAELLGVQLFAEYVELFTAKKTLVDDVCTPYTGPLLANCSGTSECCNDGQCPPPNTPNQIMKCVAQSQVTDGTKYICETQLGENYCIPGSTTAGCTDANQFTKDECIDYVCTHTLINYSEAATAAPVCLGDCCYTASDCADGMFTTIDKCLKADPNPSTRGTCSNIPRF